MAKKVYSSSVGNKYNSSVKPNTRRKHNGKTKKRNRNGKGGAYRVLIGDKQYKENYDKIFNKRNK